MPAGGESGGEEPRVVLLLPAHVAEERFEQISGRDPRERHGGVSHHTRSALRLILAHRDVVWPSGLNHDPAIGPVVEIEVEGWREICSNLSLMHMGRTRGCRPVVLRCRIRRG